jgi:PAS domain-containing protein
MIVARPISEICRELAESALQHHHHLLAQLLRMAALEAADSGVRHKEAEANIRDLLVGTWDWDIANDRIYADARFASLFGVSARQAAEGTPLQVWLASVHPHDVGEVSDALKAAIASGTLFSREYRIVSGGETRWVYARGKCTMDQAGKAVRFPGAIVDITPGKIEDHQLSIVPS